MKKILKMLVLGLLSAALLCCALPSAFAAEQKDAQVYTIGLDAMGGTSSVVAVTTNLNGKLSALPAQPTLDGYTFDGWYTETVGGTKVTTSTVFTGDTTVYAHWTVKSTAASSSTSTSKPAQPEQPFRCRCPAHHAGRGCLYVTTCFRFTLHQTINRKEDPHVCYETA